MTASALMQRTSAKKKPSVRMAFFIVTPKPPPREVVIDPVRL